MSNHKLKKKNTNQSNQIENYYHFNSDYIGKWIICMNLENGSFCSFNKPAELAGESKENHFDSTH